jgi:hypothetical protein
VSAIVATCKSRVEGQRSDVVWECEVIKKGAIVDALGVKFTCLLALKYISGSTGKAGGPGRTTKGSRLLSWLAAEQCLGRQGSKVLNNRLGSSAACKQTLARLSTTVGSVHVPYSDETRSFTA